jgi:tetraacyldisaccharide 4'-kinase
MKFWYSQNPVAWCLYPLSLVFRVIAALRKQCYRSGILHSSKPPVPVIIVGNIAVGGTGKTPLLIALCDYLKQKGLRAGVVSRGYGGSLDELHSVNDSDTAAQVGDEPMLIKQRTSCPVVIAADRPAAAHRLVEQHDCNVILSDDGLQHYALQRDIEIAVVDASRLHGNGFCLPAGPLREPPSRLNSVDIVAFNDAGSGDEITTQPGRAAFTLQFTHIVNLLSGEQAELSTFLSGKVHAVAGIGNPSRFFEQLRQAGLTVIEHAFDDHHAYVEADLAFDDGLPVLMTEKDAVKCRGFATGNFWSVNVDAVLNPALLQQLQQSLSRAGIST